MAELNALFSVRNNFCFGSYHAVINTNNVSNLSPEDTIKIDSLIYRSYSAQGSYETRRWTPILIHQTFSRSFIVAAISTCFPFLEGSKKGDGASSSSNYVPELPNGEELQCDVSVYNSLHAFHVGWPYLMTLIWRTRAAIVMKMMKRRMVDLQGQFCSCVVNLTLIDLPGLTKVAVDGQAESIVQDIENMVGSYIEKGTCGVKMKPFMGIVCTVMMFVDRAPKTNSFDVGEHVFFTGVTRRLSKFNWYFY